MEPTNSPAPTWADEAFTFATRHRVTGIRIFKVAYLVLLTILFFGGWKIYLGQRDALVWYRLAPWMGRAGIVAYILTTIPGTVNRFRLQHKLIQILRVYRREIGILTYMFLSVHYFFLHGIASWFGGITNLVPEPLFMQIGLTAYFLMFFMFATSNNFSTRHLGPWWGKIHRLTYFIIWFIVFHVALQRISIWSVAIIATAILQGFSFLYAKKQKLLRDSGHSGS
jgi:DMSO/TMAO reductase YedYZ heme-binding membrane subunit